MRTATALLIVAMANPAIAAEVMDGVPAQFQGGWNSVPAHCGTSKNDSALRIEKDHIYFWESDGPILAVVAHGKHEIAIIVELSGEGQTWLSTAHFKLSPAQDRLVYASTPGEDFVRHRCPPGKSRGD
jgi:hypothetical protein